MGQRIALFGSAIQAQPDNTLSSLRRVLTRPDRVITMVIRCSTRSEDSDRRILWERRTPACMWSPGRDGASGETEPPLGSVSCRLLELRSDNSERIHRSAPVNVGSWRGVRVQRPMEPSALVRAPEAPRPDSDQSIGEYRTGSPGRRPGPVQSQSSSSRSLAGVRSSWTDDVVSEPWRSGSSHYE